MIEAKGGAAPSEAELLTGPRTAGLALSMFLVGSFFLALSPILPDVARGLGADAAQLGYPGGAHGLALAPFHDIVPRRVGRLRQVGQAGHIGHPKTRQGRRLPIIEK